jgi:hypothetical protein
MISTSWLVKKLIGPLRRVRLGQGATTENT